MGKLNKTAVEMLRVANQKISMSVVFGPYLYSSSLITIRLKSIHYKYFKIVTNFPSKKK